MFERLVNHINRNGKTDGRLRCFEDIAIRDSLFWSLLDELLEALRPAITLSVHYIRIAAFWYSPPIRVC
jgi:hypothetical protein